MNLKVVNLKLKSQSQNNKNIEYNTFINKLSAMYDTENLE